LEDLEEEERRKEKTLLRVAGRMKKIDFGKIGFATHADKDDLDEIDGIGPFIEEKLNSLGIYKFSQIARMDSELEDRVNEAIEFLPGRVKRDRWVDQANVLAANPNLSTGEKGFGVVSLEAEHQAVEAMAMLRKKAERRRSMEMAERALAGAQRREAEELVRKKAEARKSLEDEGKDILDKL
jgi:predicted flap endonuclease-1-like 5' DNA nuclease